MKTAGGRGQSRVAAFALPEWSQRQVRRIALGVGALQTALVGWIIASSGYLKDDYPFLALGRSGGFGGAELSRSVFGSFVPGFQLGFSILASFHPIPRWPAVVLPLLLYALALFLFFRLADLLIGTRPVLVVLMAVAGLSGVLATSLTWWTAGLNSLPAVVFDLLALDGLARHAMTGKRRYLVVSAVSFGAGIFFYDASVTFLAVLVVFTGLYLAQGNDWQSLLRSFTSRMWLWFGYAVPVVFSLAWRSAHSGEYTLDPLPTIGQALRFAGAGWTQGFIPSSFGFSFTSVSPGVLRWLLVLSGQVLFFGLVAFSIYRRREAWRAWAVFGAGFAAIELIAAIGRASAGTLFALNTVYWTDQPFLLSIAIALAFFPMRKVIEAPESPAARKTVARRMDTRLIGLVAVLSLVLCGLGIRAMWTVSERTGGAMNATYVHNVEQSWSQIQKSSAHPFVWDTVVPSYVLTPLFAPYDRVATTAGLLVNLRIDQATGQGYLANDAGDLVPAVPSIVSQALIAQSPASSSTAGPTAGGLCIAGNTRSRTLRVPLSTSVPAGNWFLRLRFVDSSGFSTRVSGEPVRFVKGNGSFLVPDSASIGKSSFSFAVPADSSVCVVSAAFEAPEPKDAAPGAAPLGPGL
jgi:hypothetical protein